MKTLKKMMALALAMVMILSTMTISAFAAEPATAPTKGSITVNSPVVGATYKAYKIFDMTTNAAVDAFSYTISKESPFYGAVVTYANDKTKGLKLDRIVGSDPAVYNVSASTTDNPITGYGTFDAQAFGKAMQAALTDGSPAVTADAAETAKAGTGIVAKDAVAAATVDAPVATKKCETSTDDTSDFIKIENLDLGYFLINPTYPEVAAVTVTLDDNTTSFTDADLVKNADGTVKVPRELVKDANENTENAKIVAYANATVTEAYVEKYIEDHGISTNKDGSPLNNAGKAEYKADLLAKLKADAEEKVLTAFNNNASEADHNVKEPILVFLDSSQPDAVINEKNETDKWDIPVNPTADTNPGTPDHGEPEGGKNIVVQEATADTPAYYADWSEAEIGESVHYQLRINAMNFIRTGDTDKDIQQVKEYFLADYQSAQMHFDETKGLHVSVWQGDNNNSTDITETDGLKNVTKNLDGSVNTNGYLDYTSKKDTFFKNTTDADANPAPTDIFGTGTGIMVPWVKVVDPANPELTEEALNALKAQFPIYTITNVPVDGEYEKEDAKLDGDGNKIPVKVQNGENWEVVTGQFVSVNNRVVDADGYLLDENGAKIQKTKPIYTFSLYNSDVTIVVDYWMILDDDAIVDEPGNKNYAQFGWSPVDNEDENHNPKTPSTPSDNDTPDKKEKVDEATVYTFALAWVKIDEKGNALADAEFELPFYVKKTKDGDAYVFAFTPGDGFDEDTASTYPEDKSQTPSDGTYPKFTKDNTTNIVTTDATGIITIKGVEQSGEGEYSITETKAPAGYNQLTAPFTVEAKKSSPSVTTTTKTIIYLDRDGNVTDTVTTATTTYNTENDSNVDNVPVYQFDPIVNQKGSALPSTGGIGTTIFYAMGAILVLGAGILLVSKRRAA